MLPFQGIIKRAPCVENQHVFYLWALFIEMRKSHYGLAYCYLTLLFATILQAATAQNADLYKPVHTDLKQKEQINSYVKNVNQQMFKELDGQFRKEKKDVYKYWFTEIDTLLASRRIFYSAKHNSYLKAIATEIVKANPALAQMSFEILFTRDAQINAAALPNNLLFVHMGTLLSCENESQLAFVVAHEMAHLYLNHSGKRLETSLQYQNSKETQAELKRIKNMEYGKRELVEALGKNMAFSYTKRSRDHELQADSMALALLQSTRFDVGECTTAMDILDKSDSLDFDAEKAIVQVFSSPGLNFKKRWLQKEDGLLGGHAELEKEEHADSLKTHPDCKIRKEKLQQMLGATPFGLRSKNVVDESLFQNFKQEFIYESLYYPYENYSYSLALYYCLQQLSKNENDGFAVILLGKTMNSLYEVQKKHRLSMHVHLPAPRRPKPYNTVLQFIQNLFLEDIAAINYSFLQKHEAALNSMPEFKSVLNTARLNAQKH